MPFDATAIKNTKTPAGLPFKIGKLGHVVLMVTDMVRSVHFYTEFLGFRVSDVYPEDMAPGGMVFMRCNTDHHGVALVGGALSAAQNRELHHLAFEVSTLGEALFNLKQLKFLKAKAGAGPAAKSPGSFVIPTTTRWRSIGALTRLAVTV